jgi:hypothetical protein
MTEQLIQRIGRRTIIAVGIAAVAALPWGGRCALSLVAGGIWNLASLWLLTRLLGAWLGPRPSTRRAVGWLLLKFPMLYLAAFMLLHQPSVSVIGFGIGFTVVLAAAVADAALQAGRITTRPNGR